MSCTMLIRLPTTAFSSEDFPTFGRPTIATTGMDRRRGGVVESDVVAVSVDMSLSVVEHDGMRCQRSLRSEPRLADALARRVGCSEANPNVPRKRVRLTGNSDGVMHGKVRPKLPPPLGL